MFRALPRVAATLAIVSLCATPPPRGLEDDEIRRGARLARRAAWTPARRH
jgi:hypothetical protein